MSFMDSLMQGAALGQGMGRARDNKRIGGMLNQGDYAGAQKAAYGAGRVDQGNAIAQHVAGLRAEEREQLKAGWDFIGTLAQRGKGIPEPQRHQRFSQFMQARGMDPALLNQVPDLSDQTLDMIAATSLTYKEQLSQENDLRDDRLARDRFGLDVSRHEEDVRGAKADEALRGRGYDITAQNNLAVQALRGREADLSEQRFAQDQTEFAAEQEAAAYERANPAGEMPSQGKVTALQSTLTNIDRLMPGGDLAQGFERNFALSRFAPKVPGGPRANADALLKQITGNLTLEESSALKGVLSDKDMQLLAQAATRLNEPNIGDQEAVTALSEVRSLFAARLEEARQGGGARPAPGQPQDEEAEIEALLMQYAR